jgi:hypothetical protein
MQPAFFALPALWLSKVCINQQRAQLADGDYVVFRGTTAVKYFPALHAGQAKRPRHGLSGKLLANFKVTLCN